MQISSNSSASQLIAVQEASAKTQSQIGAALAKKVLDVQRQQGEAAVQLVEQAGGIDLRA